MLLLALMLNAGFILIIAIGWIVLLIGNEE